MSQENIDYIEASVKEALKILKSLRQGTYKGKSTPEFKRKVKEQREALITQAEVYIIKPEDNVTPMGSSKHSVKRVFKPEDEPIRNEIREKVEELFKEL